MKLLAHRGASHDFPENTIEAFRGAIEQKADGVEFDVMRCGSGEVVVCHDDNLQRLGGVNLSIAKTPWDELQKTDVGSKLGFKPAKIPLFKDVMALLPANMLINIELKNDHFRDDGLVSAVGSIIYEHGWADRVLISSFNPFCLLRMKFQFPDLARGYLIDPDRSFWVQSKFWVPVTAKDSVHPHFSQCTTEHVGNWKTHGWKTAVWTVDDVEIAKQMQKAGAEILITNRPGWLRTELKK